MTAVTSLSVGGAIASTDYFYAVETVGVGGVSKRGSDFEELALDFVAGACLGSGLVADPTFDDGADTLTFSLEDIDEAQLIGRAAAAGTGEPTVLSVAQVLTMLGLTDAADIEVGTWEPTFTFSTPGDLGTPTYGARNGHYIRIGDLVFVYCFFQFTPTWTTASGSGVIGNLPFTIKTDGILYSGGGVVLTTNDKFTWPSGVTNISLAFDRALAGVVIRGQGSAQSTGNFTTSNFTSGMQHNIQISGIYHRD